MIVRLANGAGDNLVVDVQLLVAGGALGVGKGHRGDTVVDRGDAGLGPRTSA